LLEIIASSSGHFVTFLLTFIIILLSLSSIWIDDSNAVTEQNQTSLGAPIVVVPAITQNLLTLVSFLLGTSSFILGLRIQSAARTASTSQSSSPTSSSLPPSIIDKYFQLLILALVIPALIIIIYGIVLIGSHVYYGNVSYLILLFTLFAPAGVVLFLDKKLAASRDKT